MSSTSNSNYISKTLVSEWLVTADNLFTSLQRETLSELDEWQTRSSHWLGFSLLFDSILEIETVKHGLTKTLAHVPALGARVDASNNKDGLYELVLSPDNQGVVLEYYKGTCTNGTDLPNDMDTRKVWKRAGLNAPGPGYNGEASLQDPLMRARLVVFEKEQVSYLCIGINHGVCDGSGMCDILQIWSHYCTHETKEGLPPTLSRPRVFGQRVTAPKKPAISDTTELYSRMESDVGCTQDPFSLSTLLFSIIPRAIWCMSRQQELELRISAKRLLELKQTISAKLPTGEWVSRFQVLMATILLAQRTSTSPPPNLKLHVACDLRGRAERFPIYYFGNAAFDFCQPLDSLPTEWNMENLAIVAQKVHSAIRMGLEDPENICKTKDWFEAARHLGIKNKYDIWAPVVMDALNGDGTFVNSWDKRWMDINMGGTGKAKAMVAFFGILQNLVIEVPRHAESGDSTIYLALPPAHAKRFREFCKACDELPFDIVESKV